MISSAVSSSTLQSYFSCEEPPIPIHPKQIRLTFIPVSPSLVYSIPLTDR